MLDEKNSDLKVVPDETDHVHEFRRFLGVHAGCRLVQKKQLGIRRERSRDLKAPLCPVREIAGGDLREPVQFQDLKELHRLLFYLPLYGIILGKTQDRRDGRIRHYIVEAGLDIVEDRQVAEKADVLEGPRDTGLVDVHDRFPRCILPVEEDLAPGRFIHLGQKIENGGLSRAVRADQSHDLSVKDLQVQVVDSCKASEVDAQFLYIQYRRLAVLRIESCSFLLRDILSGPVLISHWKHLLSLCRR